jgi:hypothetical protein
VACNSVNAREWTALDSRCDLLTLGPGVWSLTAGSRDFLKRTCNHRRMELLPYAWFIIVLALPFLVIAAIAAAFIAGIAGTAAAIGGRLSGALIGVMLIAGSGTTAMTIKHWITSPPTDAATSAHRIVHQAFQEMRTQFLARRWLYAGTFNRVVEEQQRARTAVQRLRSTNDGVAAPDRARMHLNESTP